jgi:hypothetical protein
VKVPIIFPDGRSVACEIRKGTQTVHTLYTHCTHTVHTLYTHCTYTPYSTVLYCMCTD